VARGEEIALWSITSRGAVASEGDLARGDTRSRGGMDRTKVLITTRKESWEDTPTDR